MMGQSTLPEMCSTTCLGARIYCLECCASGYPTLVRRSVRHIIERRMLCESTRIFYRALREHLPYRNSNSRRHLIHFSMFLCSRLPSFLSFFFLFNPILTTSCHRPFSPFCLIASVMLPVKRPSRHPSPAPSCNRVERADSYDSPPLRVCLFLRHRWAGSDRYRRWCTVFRMYGNRTYVEDAR
ncbi:hypothetical protein BJ912DRAFT_523272 [Pholiota molesta]|nr:hypothetical protein BJ912DRAFT_523272 [Pholiota molesta]